MSQPLYERYKDALRRGHIAALRGRAEVALAAYAEAAALVPERPLPHVSIGEVLRTQGRLAEARASLDAALGVAPRDEAALLGRAAVLEELGHRTEAAEDLATLAEIVESEGRLGDAVDLARRALSLAESKGRRRLVERLEAQVRQNETTSATTPDGLDAALAAMPEGEEALGHSTERETVDHARDVAADPTSETAPLAASVPEPPADAAALVAEGEALLLGGDVPAARDKLLAGAAAHRDAGRPDAAFDACFTLLGAAPADVGVHLAIADLELDRGWRPAAQDKLRLIIRLADLADDPTSADAARELARARLGAVPTA